MSAAVLTKPRAAARGLVRTTVRLHRAATWVWVGYIAITLTLLLWLWGPGSAEARDAFTAFGYEGTSRATHYADGFWDSFFAFDHLFYEPLTWLRIATVAVAVYAAGPLVARELESGTVQLAWTQSVSPARWLAAKLALPALAVAAGTGAVVVLYRLVWGDRNHLLVAGIGPRDFYYSVGPTTVADALFALALGVLAALVLRRTLAAAAVAGVGSWLVGSLRGNSWPFQGKYQQPEIPVHSKALTASGAEIRDPECMTRACLDKHGITGFDRHYLTAPEYWPRQLAETGILLTLAAVAVAAAFLLLRRIQPRGKEASA
jgi:hypothetical protein